MRQVDSPPVKHKPENVGKCISVADPGFHLTGRDFVNGGGLESYRIRKNRTIKNQFIRHRKVPG